MEELVIAPIFCLSHLKNRVLFCDMGEVHKKIGILTDGVQITFIWRHLKINMRGSWEEGGVRQEREKETGVGERTETLPIRRPAVGHEKEEIATREIDAGSESKS